ncbi:PIF1-like helicase [Medicago truncatula]|uniref:PIF1-like helicase n=1 Tax=Medicago truncatula TaxID=3880 RepID=G7IWR6_MEDTR|nr:PIF1-like helicase [Medicago truncatula]
MRLPKSKEKKNEVVDGADHSGRFREALFRDNEHFPSNTYPNLLEDMSNIDYFQNRAILAPKNSIVDRINEYVLDLITDAVDNVHNVHTPEFLNTLVSSGLPNHKLRLKVGVPVMLLRNIDQSLGLCIGTRLVITRMGKFVLEGKVISGSNIGDKVFIPRLSLTRSDTRIHFKSFSIKHALSRVTSREGLKILIFDDDGEDIDVTSNVVYNEVIRNVS